MAINVNFQIVPFGQIVFKGDSLTYEPPKPMPNATQEKIEYHEPQQTSPLVYEVIYKHQLNDFVVPASTTGC